MTTVTTPGTENLTYPDNLQNGDENHWVMFVSYPQLFAEKTSRSEYNIVLPMGAQALISSSVRLGYFSFLM